MTGGEAQNFFSGYSVLFALAIIFASQIMFNPSKRGNFKNACHVTPYPISKRSFNQES
jgi:hypothetical protein